MFECQAFFVRAHKKGPFLYSDDVRKRIRFRPPGLKPTTKVGSLGPYRGRLGFAWVVAPIVAGVVILLAGWLLLR